MKKSMRCAAVIGFMALFFGALIACKNDSDDNDDGAKVLPGTKGGITNTKDVWAGKTFYEKDKEYDEKYVFDTDGTFVIYENYEEWTPWQKYEYSLSNDGSYIYVRVVGITVNLSEYDSYDSTLYTYSEASDLLSLSESKEFLLQMIKADSYYKGKIRYLAGVSVSSSDETVVSEYITFQKKALKERFAVITTFKVEELENGFELAEYLPSAANLPELGWFMGDFYGHVSRVEDLEYHGVGRYGEEKSSHHSKYNFFKADKTYLYSAESDDDFPNNLIKTTYTLTCTEGSATLRVTVPGDEPETLTYEPYAIRMVNGKDK